MKNLIRAIISCSLIVMLVLACNTSIKTSSKVDVSKYLPNTPIHISYGTDSLQYGELRIPEGHDRYPIIMIIHGGCWQSQYDLSLMDSMAVDFSKRGYASWNIEYRRTEDIGGGWPGTFNDVSSALKHITTLSKEYPIDSDRVYITGHSAGGHLALWLGASNKISPNSDLYSPHTLDIKGIISLAGIVDLKSYYSPSGCGSNVINLIGGPIEKYPNRYVEGSPISYLPFYIPQLLINGEQDKIVSIEHITPYLNKGVLNQEQIQLLKIPDAGHFEVITPGSIAWPMIIDGFDKMINK